MKSFGIPHTRYERDDFCPKDKRKDRAKKLFKKLKHPLQQNMLCFSSDEKNFFQDLMVNTEQLLARRVHKTHIEE